MKKLLSIFFGALFLTSLILPNLTFASFTIGQFKYAEGGSVVGVVNDEFHIFNPIDPLDNDKTNNYYQANGIGYDVKNNRGTFYRLLISKTQTQKGNVTEYTTDGENAKIVGTKVDVTVEQKTAPASTQNAISGTTSGSGTSTAGSSSSMPVAVAPESDSWNSGGDGFQDPVFGTCKKWEGEVCVEYSKLNSYEDWITKVWNWSLILMIPLSAVVLSWAGLIYTTSEGNPQRIGMAKKYVIGVVSGVALLILARLFLVGVLGMPIGGSGWNILN